MGIVKQYLEVYDHIQLIFKFIIKNPQILLIIDKPEEKTLSKTTAAQPSGAHHPTIIIKKQGKIKFMFSSVTVKDMRIEVAAIP